MTVWCAGLDETAVSYKPAHQTIIYTEWHIPDVVLIQWNSPDDGQMANRNMQRKEINIYEKELCVKLVIYKDYTEMEGQQNIK